MQVLWNIFNMFKSNLPSCVCVCSPFHTLLFRVVAGESHTSWNRPHAECRTTPLDTIRYMICSTNLISYTKLLSSPILATNNILKFTILYDIECLCVFNYIVCLPEPHYSNRLAFWFETSAIFCASDHHKSTSGYPNPYPSTRPQIDTLRTSLEPTIMFKSYSGVCDFF